MNGICFISSKRDEQICLSNQSVYVAESDCYDFYIRSTCVEKSQFPTTQKSADGRNKSAPGTLPEECTSTSYRYLSYRSKGIV